MTSVIQFLESMGNNAAMARMCLAQYRSSVDREVQAPAHLHEALLARDADRLTSLISQREVMYCVVFSPEDAPNSPESDVPGDTDGEVPADIPDESGR